MRKRALKEKGKMEKKENRTVDVRVGIFSFVEYLSIFSLSFR